MPRCSPSRVRGAPRHPRVTPSGACASRRSRHDRTHARTSRRRPCRRPAPPPCPSTDVPADFDARGDPRSDARNRGLRALVPGAGQRRRAGAGHRRAAAVEAGRPAERVRHRRDRDRECRRSSSACWCCRSSCPRWSMRRRRAHASATACTRWGRRPTPARPRRSTWCAAWADTSAEMGLRNAFPIAHAVPKYRSTEVPKYHRTFSEQGLRTWRRIRNPPGTAVRSTNRVIPRPVDRHPYRQSESGLTP